MWKCVLGHWNVYTVTNMSIVGVKWQALWENRPCYIRTDEVLVYSHMWADCQESCISYVPNARVEYWTFYFLLYSPEVQYTCSQT